jgi:hypothetical protein
MNGEGEGKKTAKRGQRMRNGRSKKETNKNKERRMMQ